MMHYGHCNALRQARKLGARLFVGIHSDEEIIRNKGPPLVPYAERLATLCGRLPLLLGVVPPEAEGETEKFSKEAGV